MNIAVVTGASSGLGAEFVRQISKKFKTIEEIWVIARREDRLNELAKEIENIVVRPIVCDVSDINQLELYRNMLKEQKPSIRVLVNAAGYGMLGHFEDISEEDNCGMCDVNMTALTRITYISIPYMSENKSNIINIASSAAFGPQASFAVYGATKAYVRNFSIALRRELRYKGIAVTAVCPGPVNTEFFDVAEKYTSIKLIKKLFRAEPEDVVNLALIDAYHNKHTSVYGVLMKMYRVVSKILPFGISVKFFS